jgi:hypothetical protein
VTGGAACLPRVRSGASNLTSLGTVFGLVWSNVSGITHCFADSIRRSVSRRSKPCGYYFTSPCKWRPSSHGLDRSPSREHNALASSAACFTSLIVSTGMTGTRLRISRMFKECSFFYFKHMAPDSALPALRRKPANNSRPKPNSFLLCSSVGMDRLCQTSSGTSASSTPT